MRGNNQKQRENTENATPVTIGYSLGVLRNIGASQDMPGRVLCRGQVSDEPGRKLYRALRPIPLPGELRTQVREMKKLPSMLALMLWLCLAVPAFAGPLEDGSAAYNKKDYATALRLWRPFADRGNAIAQYILGVMYDNGQGVPQDYVLEITW